jgi:hypothetical protein
MKLGVRLDQPLYLSLRAGLGKAEGNLTNDLVTLVAHAGLVPKAKAPLARRPRGQTSCAPCR